MDIICDPNNYDDEVECIPINFITCPIWCPIIWCCRNISEYIDNNIKQTEYDYNI
jgi:hypothetical protein